MGKCVRIRGSSKPPPSPPASCLTLRSGRRVPPVSCSPRTTTSGSRTRRHRGSSALRWCRGGAGEGAKKKSACGGSQRRISGEVLGARARQQLCDDDDDHAQHQQVEEVPPSRPAADAGAHAAVARGVDDGRGDSIERTKTPLMTDDPDAAAAKVKARHKNESHRCFGVVAGQTPPTEAEIEAFFAAAELAERRRFAEAYNYDVALDRPLEGRFEWAPVST